jgi:thiamine biosynthesis lipoprotein ApbE
MTTMLEHIKAYDMPRPASVHGGHENESFKSVVERLRKERNDLRSTKAGTGSSAADAEKIRELKGTIAKLEAQIEKLGDVDDIEALASEVSELSAANKSLQAQLVEAKKALLDVRKASAASAAQAPKRDVTFIPPTVGVEPKPAPQRIQPTQVAPQNPRRKRFDIRAMFGNVGEYVANLAMVVLVLGSFAYAVMEPAPTGGVPPVAQTEDCDCESIEI